MDRKFCFDPVKDRHEVDQFGFINLREAYEHGTVNGAVSFDAEKFNGVSDASTLMNRPRDVFEAMRQSEYVKSVLKAAKAKPEQQQASDDE